MTSDEKGGKSKDLLESYSSESPTNSEATEPAAEKGDTKAPRSTMPPTPPKVPSPIHRSTAKSRSRSRRRHSSEETQIIGAENRRAVDRSQRARLRRLNAAEFEDEDRSRDRRRGSRRESHRRSSRNRSKSDRDRPRLKSRSQRRRRASTPARVANEASIIRDKQRRMLQKEREADEKALAEKFAEPPPGQTLNCPLCSRYGFKGQFALSQHMWSKHDDHPEALLRSKYYAPQARGKGASSSAKVEPISTHAEDAQATKANPPAVLKPAPQAQVVQQPPLPAVPQLAQEQPMPQTAERERLFKAFVDATLDKVLGKSSKD